MSALGLQVGVPPLGGGGSILPLTLDFTALPDGALPSSLTGATWSVSGGVVVNTPTADATMVTDGNMEAANVTSWPASGTPTTREKSGTQKHAGSQSLHIISDGNGEGARTGSLTTAVGAWYRIAGWTFSAAGAAAYLTHSIGASVAGVANTTAAWVASRCTHWETTLTGRFARAHVDTGEGYFDDYEVVPLTLSTLLATVQAGQADVTVKVGITSLPINRQVGLVLNVDSAANPQNMIVAILDKYSLGTDANVFQYLAGAWSLIYNVGASDPDGTVFEVRKSGTTYSLWLDGAQLGVDQTINQAAINNNTLHGLFSPDTEVTLNSFFAGAN